MATPAAAFAQELDRIAARYEAQFAGHARATRNLDELDALIRDTESMVLRIKTIPAAAAPAGLAELLATASDNVTLYKKERQLIVQAKNAPPEVDSFAPLATGANLAFARYHRHFAGQSRATRDGSLLRELIADLEAIGVAMDDVIAKVKSPLFGEDRSLVRSTSAMYTTELRAIEEAHVAGSLDERGSGLAQRANGQFKAYQDHFAGKSRSTRRPALLSRMIEELEAVQDEMRVLKDAGLDDGNNTNNIGIVERQIAMFKAELAEVRKARKTTSLADLMGLLGGAANEVFAEYGEHFAGKDRKTRDLVRLSKLCDQLGEIRRQMLDLGRAESSDQNQKNLDIVTEQLSSYEREFELIASTQKG